ncbi:MAG: hypothetical protein E6R13_07620 [Spirochaetes bacterium]|nr:MAG: hypothetical protein E6R13_07620 [Spirochaetota bacterium]
MPYLRGSKFVILNKKKGGGLSDLPVQNGVSAWFDASDLSTLFQDNTGLTPITSDAQTIGLWKDKSGNSNNALQVTAGSRPIYKIAIQNSKSGIQFTGTQHIDTIQTFNPFSLTLFVAAKRNATVGATMGIISLTDSVSGGSRVSFPGSNVLNARVASSSVTAATTGTVLANIGFVGGMAIDTTNVTVLLNAESVNATHSASSANRIIRIGGLNVNTTASLFGGNIYEILMYNSKLSSTDITATINYLNTKWALP